MWRNLPATYEVIVVINRNCPVKSLVSAQAYVSISSFPLHLIGSESYNLRKLPMSLFTQLPENKMSLGIANLKTVDPKWNWHPKMAQIRAGWQNIGWHRIDRTGIRRLVWIVSGRSVHAILCYISAAVKWLYYTEIHLQDEMWQITWDEINKYEMNKQTKCS